jgi:hypothetical protein
MLPVAEVAQAAGTSGTIYTLLYIVLAAFGIGGVGGIAGLVRGIRKSGARDSNIDLTVKAVLDPETGTVVKIDALTLSHEHLASVQQQQNEMLHRIEHKITSNGLGSNNVGDIAKRVENAVKDIDTKVRETNTKLDTHIGQHDERDAKIARRVVALEKRRRQEILAR